MVYLIHFDKPYKHACHYIGFSNHKPEERLEAHRSGQGARLLAVLNQNNIGYDIVRIWESEDQAFERKLKNRKNARRYCPICKKLNK